jgi:hypothetical protein
MLYQITVTVTQYDHCLADVISEALRVEFPLKAHRDSCIDIIYAIGDIFIFKGESELNFVDRIAAAVFSVNRGPCTVKVSTLCMDTLPYEHHTRDSQDFDRLMHHA